MHKERDVLPMVSVVCPTFNHAEFIAQCLDGILMQETDFHYEVLVGEDDSRDGTREICQKYAARHPDRIRLFLNDRKNVIYIEGRATGRWNLVNLLNHARGKYIAFCEGDDYWLSPQKLQVQVNFLERNPQVALCFHNVLVMYDDHAQQPHATNSTIKEILSVEDLLDYNPIYTASCVFRRDSLSALPQCFYEVIVADWFLFILIALQGKIRYFSEIMSVYRRHKNSLWSGQSEAYRIQMTINMFQRLDAILSGKHLRMARTRMSKYYLRLAELMSNSDIPTARGYWKRAIMFFPLLDRTNGWLAAKLLWSLWVKTPAKV